MIANQPDTKSSPNRNRLTKQRAVISIQLNIVACPNVSREIYSRHVVVVVAPFLLLSVVIVALPLCTVRVLGPHKPKFHLLRLDST